MKKISIIAFVLLSGILKSQCTGTESFTIFPPPIGGQYQPGTIINVCYQMDGWNGFAFNANWIEGFEINLGPGLSPPSPNTPPNNCDGGGGSWVWVTDSVLSTNTFQYAGPGWFFEVDQGGPIDGNPGNDWGDYGETCIWEFCFSTTVLSTCSLTNLNISVSAGADGTWGSWGSNSCIPIPFQIFNGTSIYDPIESIVTSPILDSICFGESTLHTILDTTGLSVFSPNDSVQITWNSVGTNFVQIIEENYAGCVDTTIFTIEVLELPIVNIDYLDSLCMNDDPIQMFASPSGGIWNINSGIFDPQIGSQMVTYSYQDAFGCLNIDSLDVNVYSNPEDPIINGQISFINCTEENRFQTYWVQNTIGSIYFWSLNGGELVGNNNTININLPNTNGITNEISVYEENEFGCISSPSQFFTSTTECGEVFIPNSFSPNGDKINDDFGVETSSDISNFEMMIFDDFGQIIYTFKDQEDRWGGDNSQNDVYIYKFKGKLGNRIVDKIGHVSLIR